MRLNAYLQETFGFALNVDIAVAEECSLTAQEAKGTLLPTTKRLVTLHQLK
jgi:hypothetical protein